MRSRLEIETPVERPARRGRIEQTAREGRLHGPCLQARIKAAEPARVLRLTAGHVLVESDTPLAPGGEVPLGLPLDQRGPTAGFGLRLRARVSWCRAVCSRLTGTLAYRAYLELLAVSSAQAAVLDAALACRGATPLPGLPGGPPGPRPGPPGSERLCA
jgi:hypothetical protein